MLISHRSRLVVSAVGSGCLVVAVALAGDERPVSTDWVFPSLMALLCGWGVIFNLLTFRAGCGAEAFTVNYPTEGNEPDRPMSPCLTTIILTVFWITGAMMLGTVTG